MHAERFFASLLYPTPTAQNIKTARLSLLWRQLDFIECLVDIGHNIINILNTDGEAHKAIG